MMINTLLMHTLFPGFDQASTRAKFKMPILKMHAIASPIGPWCMASYDMVNVWARWCHYSTKIDSLIFLETPLWILFNKIFSIIVNDSLMLHIIWTIADLGLGNFDGIS